MDVLVVGIDENCIWSAQNAVRTFEKDCNFFPGKSGEQFYISECVEKIIDTKAKFIIFCVQDFLDTEQDIVESIYNIKQSINAHCIIYAGDYSQDSKLISSLNAMGFAMIITSAVQRHIISNIEDYLCQPIETTEKKQTEIINNRQEMFRENLEPVSRNDEYVYDDIDGDNTVDMEDTSVLFSGFGAVNGDVFPSEKVNENDTSIEELFDLDQSNHIPVEDVKIDDVVSEMYVPKQSVIEHIEKPKIKSAIEDKNYNTYNSEYTEVTVNQMANRPSIVPQIDIQDLSDGIVRTDQIIKIAVVGSMNRIGTTTVALQLVKFLNSIEEHNACFLELDNSGYVLAINGLYSDALHNQKETKVSFNGVDMFYSPNNVPTVMSYGYKYVVYDFGSIDAISDLASVLDKDIVLLVGGCKASETNCMTRAMRSIYEQTNVFYIFNYIPKEDIEDVKNLMRHLANKTYVLPFCPDPYMLSPVCSDIFRNILNSDYHRRDITSGAKKRSHGLFRRR